MSRPRKRCPKPPKRPKLLPGDLYNCTLPFLGKQVAINHRDPSRSIAGFVQGCRKKTSGRGSEVIVGKTFAVGTVKRALGLTKPRARRASTGRVPRASTEIVLAYPRPPMFLPRAAELPRYMLEPRAQQPLPPAPRPMLALPAPVYATPPVSAPAAPQPAVKKRGVRLSQRDRVVLSRAESTGELYLPNLGPDDTKAAQSLLKRGFFKRKNGNSYQLTDLGRDFAETPDAVRADPGDKRWDVITAEPTWMAMLPPPVEAPVVAPPPPPPPPPASGPAPLWVSPVRPAFEVRPSIQGGRVEHYSIWERVPTSDGTPTWVELYEVAQDADTLKALLPQKLAAKLAQVRAPAYTADEFAAISYRVREAFEKLGIPADRAARNAYSMNVANAIATGRYSTALDPANRTTREVFAKFTGIELPKGLKKTIATFTGQPFHVVEGVLSQGENPAAPGAFDEKEWRRYYYALAGRILAAAQKDQSAARQMRDEGKRYEAEQRASAAMQLRRLATNEDTAFPKLHATWVATWNDVGMPMSPIEGMPPRPQSAPPDMKANRRPRLAFTHQRW